jgi:hypothetical protein
MNRYVRDNNFNCDYCQRNKLDGKGYGLLPECEVQSIPFKECAVDLIGSWVVQVHGNPYEFDALTAINTVTNLVELIRVDKKTSDVVARKYAQCWSSRYPWPQRCVHNLGGEFVGIKFQHYYKIVTSEMCALVPKILNPMKFVKECTKQWEMS